MARRIQALAAFRTVVMSGGRNHEFNLAAGEAVDVDDDVAAAVKRDVEDLVEIVDVDEVPSAAAPPVPTIPGMTPTAKTRAVAKKPKPKQ